MSARKNKVLVKAFPPVPLEKEDTADLEDMVRAGLGADEDLAGFYRFAQDEPVLRQATTDHPRMRIGLLDDIFGGVILAILLQMAPIARSKQMMNSVLELAGTKIIVEKKEVILWPRADEVAFIDPSSFVGRRCSGTVLNVSLKQHSISWSTPYHSGILPDFLKRMP